MDLSTQYLGMTLTSPLVASASPVSEDIDNIKKMEDAGAGAVVLYSLFEEQYEMHRLSSAHSFTDDLGVTPKPDRYRVDPEDYFKHIHQAKESVDIPIIASLNGSSPGGWTKFAKLMEEAGADAIELNIYRVPTDFEMSGAELEQECVDILESVKSSVQIPVAVKLSPYFSNMANMALRFDEAGADALVLFNRFYQPDINLEKMEVRSDIVFSHSVAARLPMRWIAILRDRISADLAATGGINKGDDALKMLMVGANVTMLCSALMKYGIDYIPIIRNKMLEWMEKHEYESVTQIQGIMSQHKTDAPAEFEREQYMKAINHYNYHK